MEIIIGLVIIGIIVFGSIRTFNKEKKIWNNGISPSGNPWKRFDMDSQGTRGYTDGEGRYCWISYNSIDNFS